MSGGNQQKIVIGKWLSHGAKLFIFDEPTVGVDVGTKAEIYRLFARLLENGAGIILISSYLPEVYELCRPPARVSPGTAGRQPRLSRGKPRGSADTGDRCLIATMTIKKKQEDDDEC